MDLSIGCPAFPRFGELRKVNKIEILETKG